MVTLFNPLRAVLSDEFQTELTCPNSPNTHVHNSWRGKKKKKKTCCKYLSNKLFMKQPDSMEPCVCLIGDSQTTHGKPGG